MKLKIIISSDYEVIKIDYRVCVDIHTCLGRSDKYIYQLILQGCATYI